MVVSCLLHLVVHFYEAIIGAGPGRAKLLFRSMH